MNIEVENKIYKVRHNYIHRGQSPRLVLEFKELNNFVFIQFDKTPNSLPDINTEVDGYWCNKTGYREVKIKIIENDH